MAIPTATNSLRRRRRASQKAGNAPLATTSVCSTSKVFGSGRARYESEIGSRIGSKWIAKREMPFRLKQLVSLTILQMVWWINGPCKMFQMAWL